LKILECGVFDEDNERTEAANVHQEVLATEAEASNWVRFQGKYPFLKSHVDHHKDLS
jgi:hypothetical protein